MHDRQLFLQPQLVPHRGVLCKVRVEAEEVDAQLFPQRQRAPQQKTVSTCVVTMVTTDYYRLVTRQITVDDYRLTAIIIDLVSITIKH